MSWDQGIQLREELPSEFVEWAESEKAGTLEYITWFGSQPNLLILDFGDDGSLEMTFADEVETA